MPDMFRVTVQTTGYTGAPGFTNLYFIHSDPPSTGAQAAVDKVHALMDNIAVQMCQSWAYTIQSDVAVVQDTDGEILDFISTTPAAQGIFAVAGPYSSPTGLHVDWLTNTVRNSRKIMGGTFFVPLGGASYQNDGTLATATVTAFNTHTATFLAAAGPTSAVWSRPVKSPTPPHAITSPGVAAPVVGRRVPDKAAILRSRRD